MSRLARFCSPADPARILDEAFSFQVAQKIVEIGSFASLLEVQVCDFANVSARCQQIEDLDRFRRNGQEDACFTLPITISSLPAAG